MTKTMKNNKNTQTNKAAEMCAAAEKALSEKRKAIKDTALYGKIKSAVDKAIEEAASEGASGTVFLKAKIPGELGSPDVDVGTVIAGCEHPALVAETLVEDLESEGYKVLRMFGCPIAVAWPKPDAE